MFLPNIETLYHGTIYQISQIDISKGRNNKDFGKGFYMATSIKQAIGMMHKKYSEITSRVQNKLEIKNFSEKLYKIDIDLNYAKKLNVKYFSKADIDWLSFVLECREKGGTPHDFDLVIGPTADDNTLVCLRAYWQGFYGKIGSTDAKEILLKNLEPENLGVQYFVSKQDVANKLIKDLHEIEWKDL